MASTTIRKSDSYNGRYMELVCEQSMDIANNRSTIKWTLSSKGGEVNYYSTGPTSVYINAKLVYYKERVSYDAKVFPAEKGSVSGEIIVEHNDDGTKGVSVLMNTVVYSGSSKVKAYSGWWELDPIPRGVTITSAPSSYEHTTPPTVEYTNSLGDSVSKAEICIADPTGENEYVPYRELDLALETYTFTQSDMALLNEQTASGDTELNVAFVISTTTAEGSVYLHSEESTHCIVEADDTKPTVTMTISPSNPSSVPAALSNVYIQGKSGVKATISATGKYGADISSLNVETDSVGASSTFSPSSQVADTLTIGPITSHGNVEVVGNATDSRGFKGEVIETISVLPYSKPWIEPFSGNAAILCHRSDSAGNRKSGSETVWLKAKVSYYSLGRNNGCVLQWRRKLIDAVWDEQDWQTLSEHTGEAETETECFEFSGAITDEAFYLNAAYSVQIRAIDDLGECEIKEFEIPTQDVALHLGRGGKRVTVGDYCDEDDEENLFRSAWKAKFDKGMVGSILPQDAGEAELDFAGECQIGLTPFFAESASGIVIKKSDSEASVLRITATTGEVEINTYNSGAWLGWKKLSTT